MGFVCVKRDALIVFRLIAWPLILEGLGLIQLAMIYR